MRTSFLDPAHAPVRGRHDKEGRQRALVDAAVAVFSEHGFQRATTREVAERAGCSEGLIHRYFGSKQGLLLAVLQQRAEAALNATAQPQHDTLEDDLRAYLLAAMDRMWRERDTMRVTVSRAVLDSETGAEVRRLFCERQGAALEERLERHRAAGRIRADADLAAIAQTLVGLSFVNGFFGQHVFQMERAVVESMAVEAAITIARGLRPD